MKATLNILPRSFDEFMNMREGNLTHPENVCAMFLCALNIYTENPQDGIKAMNALRGPRPMNGYDESFLKDRLRNKKYLPLAYFEGAKPENNYTPSVPYVLDVMPTPRPQDVEAGYMKLFLKTEGADSPRPLTLRKKGDSWCLWEYSSILLGVKTPKAEDPWA